MNKTMLAAIAATALVTGAYPAMAATTLTNGSADGQVTIAVSNQGYFSSAIYNPVGLGAAADAVASSFTFFRAGGTGASNPLLGDGAFLTTSATSATSIFTVDSFTVTLVQTLSDLRDNSNNQTGSRLIQSYTILNNGPSTTLDLTRYLDGDLIFQSGSFSDDGGGRIAGTDGSTLFETDLATGANDQASFVGIDAAGGLNERYEIDQYSSLYTRINSGGQLRNAISGDNNGDGFIDAGRGYDVALALSRNFSIATGQTVTFTTGTVFGSGTPNSFTPGAVPEPATWAMMMVGFGGIGFAMRRRSNVTTRIRFA